MPFSSRPNVPSFTNPLNFPLNGSALMKNNETPNRIQPRPLNPELDIQFGQDSFPHFSQESFPVVHNPPHVWKESDYQLATVPSESLGTSMDAPMAPFIESGVEASLQPVADPSVELSLQSSEDEDATKLNEFLKKNGLPTFDFSVLTERNKDQMVWFCVFPNVVPRLHLSHRRAIWTSGRCNEEDRETLPVCAGR